MTAPTIYLVAGIVSGVVALNLTLFLLTWLFLKPKRKVSTVEDALTLQTRTSLSSTKHSRTELPPPPLPSPVTILAPSESASRRSHIENHPRLTRLSESDRFTSLPQKSIRSYRRKSKVVGLQYPAANFTERNLQREQSQRSHRSQRSHLSRWSQRSTDSVSLYSVASAPRDMHERLFKPKISRPTFPAHRSQSTGEDNTVSKSLLRPPTVLHIRKRYNNASDASSFPNSAFIPPPSVPPRSPLRYIANQ